MPLFVWFQKACYEHKHDENDHSFSLKRLEGMKDYLIILDILYDYIYRVSQKKGREKILLLDGEWHESKIFDFLDFQPNFPKNS